MINQYIKSAKHLLEDKIPLTIEESVLFKDFINISKYYIDKPLEISLIYSSDIFPQIVQTDNNYYLLWEKKFWELYETYLLGIGYFAQSNTIYENDIKNSISNLVKEFLMYSLENNPGISFVLADDILPIKNKDNMLININDCIDKRFATDIKHVNYKSILFQTKYYIFYHELMHINYKENPEKFSELLGIIKSLASKSLSENIRLYSKDTDDDSNSIFTKALESIVNETDMILIEELICDFQAFNILVTNLSDVYRNDDILKIICDVQETLRICTTFQCEMRYVKDIWMEFIEFNDFYKINLDPLLYDQNRIIESLQNRINNNKNRAFTRNAVLFQLIELFCLIKYKTYSPLDDVLSNVKVRDKLFPLSNAFLDNEYIWTKITLGCELQKNTKLNPKQLIEARDMLYKLKNMDVIFK